jgi:hypothetical protein
MTDQELLEAAAKACGYTSHGWIRDQFYVRDFNHAHNHDPRSWNPLHDDGDALRLAVKLRMLVEADGELYTTATACPKGWGEFTGSAKHNGDPLAATRRAIVRAAASMAQTRA